MILSPPPDLSQIRRQRTKAVLMNVVSAFVLVTAMVWALAAAIGPIIP